LAASPGNFDDQGRRGGQSCTHRCQVRLAATSRYGAAPRAGWVLWTGRAALSRDSVDRPANSGPIAGASTSIVRMNPMRAFRGLTFISTGRSPVSRSPAVFSIATFRPALTPSRLGPKASFPTEARPRPCGPAIRSMSKSNRSARGKAATPAICAIPSLLSSSILPKPEAS